MLTTGFTGVAGPGLLMVFFISRTELILWQADRERNGKIM
jgi:hypothetical protein